jgi:hypothetical protein
MMNRPEIDSRFGRLRGRGAGGLFELDGRDVAERGVRPRMVEPRDVLDDGEPQLADGCARHGRR